MKTKEQIDAEKNEMEEMMSKAAEEVIGKKMEEIVSTVKELTKDDKAITNKDGDTPEKSVMDLKRVKAPFIELGKDMNNFINDFRAMIKQAPVQKAGFTEGTPEEGGFTVPEDMETAILMYQIEASIIRPRATVITMASDTRKINKLDQTDHSYGGVVCYWIGEEDELTESAFALKQMTLVAKKLIGLTTITRELLQDSNTDMANFIVNIFGQAMVYFEDMAFLLGNGTSQPLGIISDPDVIPVNRETATDVKYEDLVDMETALKPQFRPNAVWLASGGVVAKLKKLKGDDNLPVWNRDMSGRFPATLIGYPVIESEKLPALGTLGDLVLCDLNYYRIGDRQGVMVDVSIHDRFRFDEITTRLVKRVDGLAVMKEAFVLLDIPAGI